MTDHTLQKGKQKETMSKTQARPPNRRKQGGTLCRNQRWTRSHPARGIFTRQNTRGSKNKVRWSDQDIRITYFQEANPTRDSYFLQLLLSTSRRSKCINVESDRKGEGQDAVHCRQWCFSAYVVRSTKGLHAGARHYPLHEVGGRLSFGIVVGRTMR